MERRHLHVTGIVQGVGFRPFVYTLAKRLALTGWVLNDTRGVDLEIQGPPADLDRFLVALQGEAPPLALVESVAVALVPLQDDADFCIRESQSLPGATLVSPDVCICDDCLRELFDPSDRRYLYPFINCTNCGPRFTIIADIPYDRPLTTMRDFVMCPQCQAEYDNPLDRRFHAQPNACPVCGPHVWLQMADGASSPHPTSDSLAQAARLLQAGAILAIKGLGGFHLACDATNEAAVRTLRERKQRPDKPLALMMATREEIQRHCWLSEEEGRLLTSPQCPIVLLRWKPESSVSRRVAPDQLYLGVMLPYTPLHHVLLRDVGRPLVMTSGNLSEEPIVRDNDEALLRLGPLADAFLMHNRDIYARYDDSVWFAPRIHSDLRPEANPAARPQPIRRARGYAPFPIKLPFKLKPILACGGELKSTLCVTRDEYAFLSQHIGDLENLETLEQFEATVELYQRLFRVEPEIVACDLHPDYESTRYARSWAARQARHVAILPVQHHHAHIASCLADNGWRPADGPVIGVAWDGTGYGADGHIWGGEFLVADYGGFRRAAHLEYLPMPGGEAAIRNPYRLALGYLHALTGRAELALGPDVSESERQIILRQIDRGLNCPLTSAGGRLFDAVAALLGICRRITYEGQAAVKLEVAADRRHPASDLSGYAFGLEKDGDEVVIRLRPLFEALQAGLKAQTPVEELAYRFHVTAAEMMRAVCQQLAEGTGLRTVALSGGCFQNRLLLALVVPRLQAAGLHVLLHHQSPCNDGGLALGQAMIANF